MPLSQGKGGKVKRDTMQIDAGQQTLLLSAPAKTLSDFVGAKTCATSFVYFVSPSEGGMLWDKASFEALDASLTPAATGTGLDSQTDGEPATQLCCHSFNVTPAMPTTYCREKSGKSTRGDDTQPKTTNHHFLILRKYRQFSTTQVSLLGPNDHFRVGTTISQPFIHSSSSIPHKPS